MAKRKTNKKGMNEVKTVKKSSPERNQFYVILGVMVFIIAIMLLVYYLVESRYHFTYQGLAFTIEKYDQLKVYHHYYYFTNNDQQYKYNLYLHFDPRKTDVPVNGEIILQNTKTTYIGINATGLTECKNSSLAVGSLSTFLVDNMIKVKGGTPNADEAKKDNMTLINCDLYPTSPVIIIQESNKTSISQLRSGCYYINVNNCEILQATEKFEVQSIVDARKRAGM